jgi:hypothetical protein
MASAKNDLDFDGPATSRSFVVGAAPECCAVGRVFQAPTGGQCVGLGTLAAITNAVEHALHLQTMRLGTSVWVSTSGDWQSGQVIVTGISHRNGRRTRLP